MSGGVKVTGLQDVMQQLTHAPRALREDAMAIVREETEGAAIEMQQQYARKTGTLAARVKTAYPVSGALIGIAQSTAPHSHLYEFGTRVRSTKAGANRGVMPEKPTTPQIAQRRRARMARRLIELVKSHGFQVDE